MQNHGGLTQEGLDHATAMTQLLSRAGLLQYAPVLEANRIDILTLSALSSAELREDLMITPLAHRRTIMHVFQGSSDSSTVPLFGSILVHLSNLRTFHSWLSNSVQILVFAFAMLRFVPRHNETTINEILAGTMVALATLFIMYGAATYYKVSKSVESASVYHPDWIGASLALLLTLIIAFVTFSVVIRETIPSN